MPLQRQILFWLACLAGFIAFVWLFHAILTPFVAALILAYLMDPLVNRLERLGLSRTLATASGLTIFLVIFVLLALAAAPLLFNQLGALIARLPQYMQRLQSLIAENGGWIVERIGGEERLEDIRAQLSSSAGEAAKLAGSFITSLVSGGQVLVSVVTLLVLTPVITFYLVIDWDQMIARVDGWLPRRYAPTIRQLAAEMDRSVADFLRGQALVCLILGLFYAVFLSLAGLNFGFVIGIITGILSFIPYVGTLSGLLLSIGVAIAQFSPDWMRIVIIAVIYGVGQFLEGNVLHPKLLGHALGMHPVWLMFALLGFGSLFGFVGVMLAVPLAAVIGVLIRFALRQYLASPLYGGGAPEAPATNRPENAA